MNAPETQPDMTPCWHFMKSDMRANGQKLGRCPIGHSQIQLEALVQDEAGRQLMAFWSRWHRIMAAPWSSWRIGLFRAHNRDLANDRALRLIREVLVRWRGRDCPSLG